MILVVTCQLVFVVIIKATHALLATAPREVCMMCQSWNLNWLIIVEGKNTPAATVEAP